MTHSWEKRNLKLQCQKSSVQSELGDDDDDDTFMKENIWVIQVVKQNDDLIMINIIRPIDGEKQRTHPNKLQGQWW